MMRSKHDRKLLRAVRAGRIDPRLLVSARSLCQRLEAGLDILMLTCPLVAPAPVKIS